MCTSLYFIVAPGLCFFFICYICLGWLGPIYYALSSGHSSVCNTFRGPRIKCTHNRVYIIPIAYLSVGVRYPRAERSLCGDYKDQCVCYIFGIYIYDYMYLQFLVQYRAFAPHGSYNIVSPQQQKKKKNRAIRSKKYFYFIFFK